MTWEDRLVFEVSSADPDSSTPVWVDLTDRIRDSIQPVALQVGRQNDLDQAEPGRLDQLLENSDDALTYGNTSSPYPWWGPGRKCRLRETVAGVVMDRFTGYLQVPTEVLVTAPVDPADPREQRVSITAVDRLGWLASAEPFISTLGAHIRPQPGLAAYYPLNETSGDTAASGLGTTSVGALKVGIDRRGNPFSQGNAAPLYQPGMGMAPPGEDVPCALFKPDFDEGIGTDVATALLRPADAPPFAITAATTDWVTLRIWATVDAVHASYRTAVQMYADAGSGTDAVVAIQHNDLGIWQASVTLDGNFIELQGPPVGIGVPTLVTARVNFGSGDVELYVGNTVTTDTWFRIPPPSIDFVSFDVGSAWNGSLGHAQLYVGDSTAGDNASHVAQFQVGMCGLERQPTGDRIRTIAQYAGVPAAELTQIDTGSSVMQRATLAGKDPLTAMRDAERTEQGLLYVDGNGNLVFKDRRTLYNI